MPTYEYQCEKCGKHFDVFQNMSDAPLERCPECGGHLKRLIGTGGGIIFKGSGFYATDYRKSESRSNRCGNGTTCCSRDVPGKTPRRD